MEKYTLNNVKINESAVIRAVGCDGSLSDRLKSLGITVGSIIEPIYKSPFGDPTAYLVKNAVIALRDKDCKRIWVYPYK